MRMTRLCGGLAATTLSVLGGLTFVPGAHADDRDWGVDISGTWLVHSIGEWARTNGVKFEQPSVVETWTVDVDCVSPIECSGTVTSSLGWTGTARLDAYWYVKHDVPNWMPCPDGTFAAGHQQFIMNGVDEASRTIDRDFTTMNARNVTKSDSGACGVNKSKVIELPARAEKLS